MVARVRRIGYNGVVSGEPAGLGHGVEVLALVVHPREAVASVQHLRAQAGSFAADRRVVLMQYRNAP